VAQQIVILSGHVGAGKSTLAAKLASQFGFRHVKTWGFIKDRGKDLKLERTALQNFGEQLDIKTRGAWVRDDLQKIVLSEKIDGRLVVDSVRHPGQIAFLRKAYGRRIVHVHLTAPLKELERRYIERSKRATDIAELARYSDVLANPTEAKVENLEQSADIVIDSDLCNEDDVVVRVNAV
jgi:adenylosuccinate synthase